MGLNVIRLLSEFRPKLILVNDLKDKSKELEQILKPKNIEYRIVDKEEIYRNSDIISLHLPLTPKTRNLITEKELNMFKRDSFLVNTARGELINEDNLYYALKNSRIAGAAIDVFAIEPYKGKLIELENVLLTEHMGSCSFDCRLAMESGAARDLIHYFKNEPLENEVPEEEYLYQD